MRGERAGGWAPAHPAQERKKDRVCPWGMDKGASRRPAWLCRAQRSRRVTGGGPAAAHLEHGGAVDKEVEDGPHQGVHCQVPGAVHIGPHRQARQRVDEQPHIGHEQADADDQQAAQGERRAGSRGRGAPTWALTPRPGCRGQATWGRGQGACMRRGAAGRPLTRQTCPRAGSRSCPAPGRGVGRAAWVGQARGAGAGTHVARRPAAATAAACARSPAGPRCTRGS